MCGGGECGEEKSSFFIALFFLLSSLSDILLIFLFMIFQDLNIFYPLLVLLVVGISSSIPVVVK